MLSTQSDVSGILPPVKILPNTTALKQLKVAETVRSRPFPKAGIMPLVRTLIASRTFKLWR